MAMEFRGRSEVVRSNYRFSGDSVASSCTLTSTKEFCTINSNSSMQSSVTTVTEESQLDPNDFFGILRLSKDRTKLLYACNGLVKMLNEGGELSGNKCEETVQLSYQLMINHPLDSQIVQGACEIILTCNPIPEFKDSIDECEVYRPVLGAINNHKKDPYFLGVAMETLASLADSTLSSKGLRQSQAYTVVLQVLEMYKYDVNVQTGGLLALSNIIRDDYFAQTDLVQRQKYKIVSECIAIHKDKPKLISNGFKVMRQLCIPDRCRKALLQTKIFEQAIKMFKSYMQDVDVVSGCLGFIEALATSESQEFLEKASKDAIYPLVHLSLFSHSESISVCIYGLSIIDHLCADPSLLKVGDIKTESIFRFMYSAFQQHGEDIKYQEAFTRCLGRLLEVNSMLYLFIDDSSSTDSEETKQLRVPLVSWVWVVLLSSIHDTSHYQVYQTVSLAIYYLVVDCERLRNKFMERQAPLAIFEGLRQFVNLQDQKFEKCVQYGCQAMVALLFSIRKELKASLVDTVYDLIDILERFVRVPRVATEALGVIACLLDVDEFRNIACLQNIHIRILKLLLENSGNPLLIESALEVLIIIAELQPDMHSILNDGLIFSEVIKIFEHNIKQSINIKCLRIIYQLADSEYFTTYEEDAQCLCRALSSALSTHSNESQMVIEVLICIGHLCRICNSTIPEYLVEYETDLKLFNRVFSHEEQDYSGDINSEENAIHELSVDNVHSLQLNETCKQKMLLTAIKHKMIEAVSLLISVGADVCYSVQEDFSDSPIYQAVLTKDKYVVETLLNQNIKNRQQIKRALALARTYELDRIIGLLLKSLGMDKQRRSINWGGLDLVDIKPTWIYPSLGLPFSTTTTRKHRRNKSLEKVTDMMMRRLSLDNSQLQFSSGSLQLTTKNKFSEREEQQLFNVEDAMVAGTIAMLEKRTKITTSKDDLILKDRIRGASKSPDLPTLVGSPFSTVKSNSMPGGMHASMDESSINDSTSFITNVSKNEVGEDCIDGVAGVGLKEEVEKKQEEEEEDHEIHVPARRHTMKSLSMTGATFVPFSTVDKYRRGSEDSIMENKVDEVLMRPLSLVSENLQLLDTKTAARLSLGSKVLRRLAQKTKQQSVEQQSPRDNMDDQDGMFEYSVSFSSGSMFDSGTVSKSESHSPSKSVSRDERHHGELGGVDTVDGAVKPLDPRPQSSWQPQPTTTSPTRSKLPQNVRNIQNLDLSSNKLKGLDSIVEENLKIVKKLSDLVILDLKQNSLSELPQTLMEELQTLRKLILSRNLFQSLPSEISWTSKLAELDLSNNLISSFPAQPFSLPCLTLFNLSNNALSVFPSFITGDQFPSLKILLLEGNQICYIEERETKLKNLEELSLSKNSIKELPVIFLAGMTSLKTLDISRNNLELLPGEAAEYMCKLQELKLAHNKLYVNEPQFQSFIRTALVIQYVDASDNQLTSCPPPYMWRSHGLKHLLLGENKLTSVDLSECERYWPGMERLVLADNKLKEIPPEIGKLRTLSCLDISHNREIKHLPNEIGKLDYLFYLNLQGLKNLDVDTTQNARTIVRFLKSKLIQSMPSYVMKMMIVGGAGKGKTTLLNLLINDQQKVPPKSENTATLGVNIKKWRYEHRPGIRYTINCWDFAGQEEFYGTHQCFLTPRSIYVLVYNLLKGESELESMISWLSNIQARAPDSHVVVVGTHKDLVPEDLLVSVKKTIRSQIIDIVKKPGFPKDVTFAEVSLVGKKLGLDALKIKLKEKIDGATLRKQKIMGEVVPASYLELSNLLEEESRQLSKNKAGLRFIRKSQLHEMMGRAGLDKRMDKIELEQAVQFLHECGVLLHYEDIKSNLSDLYFIDPQWLCSILSKVITIRTLTIISNQGILKTQDIPLLLKGSQFPPDLIPEYIRLLEWFDVGLQLTAEKILIPSYLPKSKPGPISLPTDTKIVRRYSLFFIPPGFWPRLVTRLLSFPRKVVQFQEPMKHMNWYSGVYYLWSLQAYFLIEQLKTSNRTFDITVPNTPVGIRLLCKVVDNIEVLIDEWYPGLRNVSILAGDMMVAPFALCPHCPAYSAHLFPMAELVELSKRLDTVKCPVHNEMVPLKLLAPDIIISDLAPKYHISYEDLVLDENNPASVIGKGGFGEVYKALYQGTTIAVKIFSTYSAEMHNTTPHQLIRQEVAILSQTNHPNIITMVGIVLRPKAMLLMEYAELGSLNTFSPYDSMSNELKHRIAVQVSSGLAYLHKTNVIYRDLKPGNILIFSLSLNDKVNAKLSDYGISTYATEAGLREDVGTVGHKAPELLKAKSSKMPYDSKVDIYCFGLVLFQLISNGHVPFEEFTPYERDKAVAEGRSIRSVSYYGCPPWPDMHDLIHHCLQYNPNDRPTAQEIFDTLCSSEFFSLREVIPVNEGWEVLCFAVRTFRDTDKSKKHHKVSSAVNAEVWIASCDVTQKSMLSCVNLSNRQADQMGRVLPHNTLILCMVSVGSSMVIFGTNSGDIIVCDGFNETMQHKLATLKDSILCLSFVRGKDNGSKPYLLAGLANGTLVAYDQCVLQTTDARPDTILSLNAGPIRGIKKYNGSIYVISGLEVFVIDQSRLTIDRSWIACDDPTRRFLTCIEITEGGVWTTAHNCPVVSIWDSEDAFPVQTINTLNSLKSLEALNAAGLTAKSSSASHSFQDPIMFRVTAMHMGVPGSSLMWVGLATGHIIVYDITGLTPLMATCRHENPVRAIEPIRATSKNGIQSSVILSCGLGFTSRPDHKKSVNRKSANNDNDKDTYKNHGVLLLWESSMLTFKSTFDEFVKDQAPYR